MGQKRVMKIASRIKKKIDQERSRRVVKDK